jgi:hypothetical protein
MLGLVPRLTIVQGILTNELGLDPACAQDSRWISLHTYLRYICTLRFLSTHHSQRTMYLCVVNIHTSTLTSTFMRTKPRFPVDILQQGC